MKVAYLSHGLDPHSYKIRQYWTVNNLDNVKENKIDICFISFNNTDNDSNMAPTRRIVINNKNILFRSQVEDIKKKTDNNNPLIIDWPSLRPRYSHFYLSIKLNRIIKIINPEIIHSVYLTTYGYYASKMKDYLIIQQAMGTDILLQSKIWPYSHWIRKAIVAADLIIVDAMRQKEIIEKKYNFDIPIKIFPVGIDLNHFKKETGDNNIRSSLRWLNENGYKIIISNRWHERIYGWKYLLKAFSYVVDKIPYVRLLALGDGTETSSLMSYAKELNINDKIVWIGRINNILMPYYLNASDIYVSASLSDDSSVSLQEAMACSKPVIVTENPAILEWINHRFNGLIVPKRDSRKLANSIIELLTDSSLDREFGERNLNIARERSSFSQYINNIEQCYIELVS